MQWNAVKEFAIIEGTIPGTLEYCFQVIDSSTGQVVNEVRRPTMDQATVAFSLLGYKKLVSREGEPKVTTLRVSET